MNYKSILCYLAISFLTASLSAGTANQQKLYKEILIKQQELHDLGEKITNHAERIYEKLSKMPEYVEKYAEFSKTPSHKPSPAEIMQEIQSFCEGYMKDTDTKNLLIREFNNQDPIMGVLKFYFLHNGFYEIATLLLLIQQWEEKAHQLKPLLKKLDFGPMK